MSKGITEKEPDPRVVYADIIDLPHWQSPTRPHMSLYDRSAQFASYKALSGYEDMIQEEARLTDAEEVDGLKLGCLTEFKRGSNGTVEIRLADRAAILEKLLEHLGDEGGAAAFLQALDRPGPSER